MLGLLLWALTFEWTTLLLAGGGFVVAIGLAFVVVKRRSPPPKLSVAPIPAPEPSGPERRSAARRSVTPVLVKLRGDHELEGLVLDVSTGGLGLSLKQPVETGEVLEVRPATAAPTVPWVRVEVRHCSTMAARWKVGCRFVETPAAEVRNLFG
jgi:hypothetical protein